MKIFIGYDAKEHTAYEVCRWSMLKHNPNLSITPLIRDQLPSVGKHDGSTEFTYTRFLVPHLMEYRGLALFCDCDFLWCCDPIELLSYLQHDQAVSVVQHENYQPHTSHKMQGVVQSSYPRKNWSSLILWNCDHPANRILTPSIIRNSTPSWLHQFGWLNDSLVGKIPKEYNWLVGYYKDGTPSAIHYTDGGPWLDQYKNCDFAEQWQQAYDQMTILNRSRTIPK